MPLRGSVRLGERIIDDREGVKGKPVGVEFAGFLEAESGVEAS